MKKVLIISVYPFHHTNRGMDVITEVFEEEAFDVTHLAFPMVFYSPKKKDFFPTKVKEVFPDFASIPYVDAVMHWIPTAVFNWIKRRTVKTAHAVDFCSYDLVVIECGKPLFLLDSIPENVPLIYRQSDSVRLILGKHPAYIALEDKAIERAKKVIVVKDVYKDVLPQEAHEKTVVIRNGFSIPFDTDYPNPYPENTANVIYMGLTPLDYQTLKYLLKENENVHFHIVGPCLKPWEKVLLRNVPNLHLYGFLPPEKYLPLIKNAHAAIIPYKKIRAVKWWGFTSKYMTYMYFGIPVISYPTGERKEFDGLKIQLVDTKEEFNERLREATKAKSRVEYDIDFDFYAKKSRKGEYRSFIHKLSETSSSKNGKNQA